MIRLAFALAAAGVLAVGNEIGAAPLVSGERIPAGGTGRGPLSAGLTNFPLGTAFVFGSRRPDLFLAPGRFAHEPGLFLYRWLAEDSGGAPVFGRRVKVGYPGNPKLPPPGVVFQIRNHAVYGFWIMGDKLVRTRFDRDRMEFAPVPGPDVLLRRPRDSAARADADGRPVDRVAVFENPDGSLELIFSVSDRIDYYPKEAGSRRDSDYHGFDGRGIWRGGLPYVFLCLAHLPGPEAAVDGALELRAASPSRREALISHGNLTAVNLGPGHERDLMTGSHFGDFYFYHNRGATAPDFAADELMRAPDGSVQRHPTIWASPVAFAANGTGISDLVVGGEGTLYYYRFSGMDPEGRPAYRRPVPVLEENALLHAGTLPVVNAVDWDGDGVTDIVAGNSEGRILFFRNRGTDESPDFSPGVPLSAGGVEIHVQQGYSALQGPDEAAWGYVAPTVADWNGDGLPDLLLGDATGRHTVYLNRGTKTAPRLAPGAALYCDGLEVHGTWRSQPGVARLGKRMAYVALDDDDEFRLYWRIDDFNVADGGKLRLADGSAIRANFLPAGATGRTRIVLCDWDGDGATDLLVGTPRHGSVPNPKTGLPQSEGLPGAAILWLKNLGTDRAPVFAFPRILRVKGKPVYFGQHECSVAVTTLGGAGRNLIVGDEEGRIWFFRRSDISWGP